MRIIAGAHKGRKLKSPKRTSLIKPILGRAKQSLFDTLRPRITGSFFLDLYAGSGTVGLEALSRGASFVVFVDKSNEGVRLIEANLKRLNCPEKAKVMKKDILGGALFLLRSELPVSINFDLVFCAPPYLGSDRRGEILRMSVATAKNLVESRLLNKGALLVLQHHKKESLDGMPSEFRFLRQSCFGDNIFTYFEFVKSETLEIAV